MNAIELIEALQKLPPDTEIFVSVSYDERGPMQIESVSAGTIYVWD